MMARYRDYGIVLLLNATGLIVFLFVAPQFWIEPELPDVPDANIADAFGWFFYVVPIALLLILGNLVWLSASIIRSDRQDRLTRVGFTIIMLACWTTAFLFDGPLPGI